MDALEQKLGYRFRNRALLETALTHSSYANEHPPLRSNERLEFLGDAVLGFYTAQTIFSTRPDMPEGVMSRLRAELVCEASLHQVALSLGLSRYLRLGRAEEGNGGRSRPSILADAVEAIIAAIFTDGGLECAERFIYEQILSDGLKGRRFVHEDYKTMLQELLQQHGGAAPSYEIIGESGPDHDKTFKARVLFPQGYADGVGKSKKEAERAAARVAWERLKG